MEKPTTEILTLGNLGIIAAIFKENKVIEKIDALLPKTSNHKHISHGKAVLAMIIQGLSFSNSRLYLSSEFSPILRLRNCLEKSSILLALMRAFLVEL